MLNNNLIQENIMAEHEYQDIIKIVNNTFC